MNKGFTLVELLVSMGIFVILMGLGYAGVARLRITGDNLVSLDKLYADIKQLQIEALLGKKGTTLGVPAPRGIVFTVDTDPTTQGYKPTYTVFDCNVAVGCVYPGNAENARTADIPTSLSFLADSNNTLLNNQIIFMPLTSEVENYNSTRNAIYIKNRSNGQLKVLRFNKYGTLKQD